jgi:hypothetical protein
MALPSAYPKLGKFLFPSDCRPSLVGDEFTDVSAELFIALDRGTGPGRLGYFSDLAYEVIDARYLLNRLTGEQLDGVRHAIDVDVREAMSAPDMLGVVVLNRNSEDAGQYGITDWSKAKVELTSLGRYAIRRVKDMAHQATRCYGSRSRSWKLATRPCGGRSSSRRATPSTGSTG